MISDTITCSIQEIESTIKHYKPLSQSDHSLVRCVQNDFPDPQFFQLENSGDPPYFKNSQSLSYWNCVYFLMVTNTNIYKNGNIKIKKK